MDLPSPLIYGRLQKRYKRFFADVELDDGSVVTAHCPNTGTMLGLCEPGIEILLSRSNNPKRKLAYTWEFVISPTPGAGLVGINPLRANALVADALQSEGLGGLSDYATIKREVRYGQNSRIDFLLTGPNRPPCYLEVKNVHLSREPGLAEFPDAVTARGTKHLNELAKMAKGGDRAVMLFLIQRGDCNRFAVARDLDPAYAKALKLAQEAAVEVLCIGCRLTMTEIVADQPIDIV